MLFCFMHFQPYPYILGGRVVSFERAKNDFWCSLTLHSDKVFSTISNGFRDSLQWTVIRIKNEFIVVDVD